MSPLNSRSDIERYIAGNMSSEEIELFEISLLEDPELLADYETILEMSSALKEYEWPNEFDSDQGSSSSSVWRMAAIAASILLAFSFSLNLVQLSSESDAYESLKISQELVLESFRGSARASIVGGAGPILVKIDVLGLEEDELLVILSESGVERLRQDVRSIKGVAYLVLAEMPPGIDTLSVVSSYKTVKYEIEVLQESTD